MLLLLPIQPVACIAWASRGGVVACVVACARLRAPSQAPHAACASNPNQPGPPLTSAPPAPRPAEGVDVVEALQSRDEASLEVHGAACGSPMRQKWLHTIHVSGGAETGGAPLSQASAAMPAAAALPLPTCRAPAHAATHAAAVPVPMTTPGLPAFPHSAQTLHLMPQQKQQLLLQREAHLALMRRIYQQRQQLNMQASVDAAAGRRVVRGPWSGSPS